MAFMTLSMDLSNAIKALGEVEPGIRAKINTNEILDAAGAMLLNRIRTRYLKEVDPDGVAWLPSKAGLLRRLTGGTGTLFKTGTLFHSIQLHKVDSNNRDISTNVPYAGFHQNGKGSMHREFLGFSGEDQTVYENIVERMLDRALA